MDTFFEPSKMKFLSSFVIIWFGFPIDSILPDKRNFIISESLQEIFKDFSSYEGKEISIIKSMRPENVQAGEDLIQEISAKVNSNHSVRVENAENLRDMKQWKRVNVVVVVDCFESFVKFYVKISHHEFDYSGFYIIVPTNNFSRVIVEKVFAVCWKILIFNVNILVENDFEDISLLTFMPFNAGTCNNVKIVKINEFDSENLRWESKNFFPRKFKNLQNCSLRVGTYESSPGLMIRNDTSRVKVYGFEGDMFNHVAEKLNFSMQFAVVNDSSGTVYENGSATGLMGRLMLNEFDLIMSMFSAYTFRAIYLTPTTSYYTDQFVIIIPGDRLLDPFAKLFYVFDLTLWFTLIAIFAITSISLHIMKPRDYLNPFLSILIVFLGGSDWKLPRKHSLRILITSLLLFCLIVRSIYQGALFNILKQDVVISKIKTIEDINRLHYTFYMTRGIDFKTKDLTIFHK